MRVKLFEPHNKETSIEVDAIWLASDTRYRLMKENDEGELCIVILPHEKWEINTDILYVVGDRENGQ